MNRGGYNYSINEKALEGDPKRWCVTHVRTDWVLFRPIIVITDKISRKGRGPARFQRRAERAGPRDCPEALGEKEVRRLVCRLSSRFSSSLGDDSKPLYGIPGKERKQTSWSVVKERRPLSSFPLAAVHYAY